MQIVRLKIMVYEMPVEPPVESILFACIKDTVVGISAVVESLSDFLDVSAAKKLCGMHRHVQILIQSSNEPFIVERKLLSFVPGRRGCGTACCFVR